MASFSPLSFSSTSFDIGQETQGGGGKNKKSKNKWRNYMVRLARDVRRIFYRPPPRPEIIQPEQLFTITVAAEITMSYGIEPQLEQISIVASSPVESPVPDIATPPPIVYPMILNPITAPIIQRTVVLPKATKQPYIAPYQVGEGTHIESDIAAMKLPRNRSKVASTLNTLMMLLDIERQLEEPKRSKAAGPLGLMIARLAQEQKDRKSKTRVRFTTQHDSKVDDEICRNLEGMEWDIDAPDIIVPPDDTHPNCRCTLEPVDEEDVFINPEELPFR